jgi:prophage regulatory protein
MGSIIRQKQVALRTGLSTVQLWRLEKAGTFPGRVRLGPRAVGWHEAEVDEWIKTRIRAGGIQPPLPKSRWLGANEQKADPSKGPSRRPR